MGRQSTAVLVAVVLLAGCNGLGPGGDRPAATETVTPAPVTTQQPTELSGPFPPGVTSNGAVSPELLLAGHRASIANSSYTWTRSYVRNVEGQERSDERSVTRVAVEDTEEALIWTDSSISGMNRTVFVDGTYGFVRVRDDGNDTFLLLERPLQPEWVVDIDRYVNRYFATADASVTRLSEGSTVYHRLQVRTVPTAVRQAHSGSVVRNYSATAYVTQTGFIRSVSVSYDLHDDGIRTHIAVRFDYEKVGETTVTVPDWIDEVGIKRDYLTETPVPTPEAVQTVMPAAASRNMANASLSGLTTVDTGNGESR